MSPSVIYANATLAAREKVKFDNILARRMSSAPTVEDAVKLLLPLGYNIEHEDHIVIKKLDETLNTFTKLCPDENLKKFVLIASKRDKESADKSLEMLRIKLKGVSLASLTYIEEYFEKGVTALPHLPQATSFDLESFLNWFIMKLEELRIVKAILIGKKLGIPREQLRSMIRGGG